jgi:hypothetical protein
MTKSQGWLVIASLLILCAQGATTKVQMLYFVMSSMAYGAAVYSSWKEES